ncbi:MAG: MotA/TolQ/ExbB proton channel family protein, partial [Spirochaetaceae bacterium]|nr:MotA/TolQ/ExbB proton channel family protein [Spirochaetaceae bacterium]
SFLMTCVGSWFALMLQYGLKDALGIFKLMGRAFKNYSYGGEKLLDKLYEFSEKARREGILSLEEEMNDLDDKFMQQGLRLVVDGTDAEVIRELMENELSQMNARHSLGIKALDAWAKLAPGFGMLGTVLGLIGMMKNLEDKSRIGPNMAVALITTFYGAIMANFLFQPMMGKLVIDDGDETTIKEMVIEGVLSIQAGDNPRILLVRLASYLPPKQKQAILDKYKTE